MKPTLYLIDGRNGAWFIAGEIFDEDGTLILVFQNVGSGEYVEIDVCPFDWILKHTNFKKWDL